MKDLPGGRQRKSYDNSKSHGSRDRQALHASFRSTVGLPALFRSPSRPTMNHCHIHVGYLSVLVVEGHEDMIAAQHVLSSEGGIFRVGDFFLIRRRGSDEKFGRAKGGRYEDLCLFSSQ